jgi:hypothetical protein
MARRVVRFSPVTVATVVLAVTGLLAGCSSSPPARDDGPRVRSAVGSFGAQLVRLHDIASVPAVYIGGCSDGWASVSFSAVLINHTADPREQELNVLGAAGLSDVRLERVRELAPPAPGEPAAIFATKDGLTQLTVTVPQDRSVRIDGYASCTTG